MSFQKLVELRRRLHRSAELSGRETETAGIIIGFLEKTDPDRLITGLGGSGIMAVYGSGHPAILLRCDMDAVPVDETLDLPYKSTNSGVSHKCGHDGHMAILAGVGRHLSLNPPKNGRVCLLFQPEEETGRGAFKILNDPSFRGFRPELVFAMHNLPGFPAGSVITRHGPFASASRGLILWFKGRSAHAGEPEKGISPAAAVARLIQEFQDLSDLEKGLIVTVIHCKIGEIAFGTAPEKAVLMATLRAPDDEAMMNIAANALKLARGAAKEYGLSLSHEWTEEFPATVNDPVAAQLVEMAAEDQKLGVIRRKGPFTWSEDFGHFTAEFPGALFGLGSGIGCSSLHSPEYDFPDDLINTGVRLWTAILERTQHLDPS